MGLFRRKGRLTPFKRTRKYRYEVRSKVHTNHFGKPHKRKGKTIPLSDTQLAFRSGYLTSVKDYKKAKKRKSKGSNYKPSKRKVKHIKNGKAIQSTLNQMYGGKVIIDTKTGVITSK